MAVPVFGVAVDTPFGDRPLPSFVTLPAMCAAIAVYPIIDWLPGFSQQVVRERPSQRLRRAIGSGVLAMSCMVMVFDHPEMLMMLLSLWWWTGVALLMVAILGRLYWLPLLGLFFVALPMLLTTNLQSAYISWVLDPKAYAVLLPFPLFGMGVYAWSKPR
ncbi:MAG: hypothetical protein ACRC0L_01845 [Angustibacter sp.]